ncbi:2-oxoacid dehydrogenases acyltransferase-domain-containing protein [Leucosporidium creatinivorum]|uniref:Dihydrolipoamide acetyltransferase component of pyruvate dehydrogenase complex n=1 Tax=Leucosporidium creatinivorum TaxID=106004 RepID=A0A1Y2G2Q2_9BASI|nr:2-oxoacid dehydrogenases acyltransferase-domain-containing protein [Leucosporidium creatinivorum]
MLPRTAARFAPAARLARRAPSIARLHSPTASTARAAVINISPALPRLSLDQREFSSSARVHGVKPFLLADIGEGITECEIVKWNVEVGQIIEEFDPVVEVMSDKATVEITSPFSGKVKSLNGAAGDVIKVGKMLCEIEMEGEGAEAEISKPVDPLPPTAPGNATAREPSDEKVTQPAPTEQPSTEQPSTERRGEKREVWATPATRRIAREQNIDLADVTGTGPQGRVTKGDVLAFVAAGSPSSQSASPPSSASSAPTPSLTSTSATITLPLSPVRKAMFRAMTSSLQIPHFAYSETLDVTPLERLRLSLNQHIPLRHRKTLKPAEEAQLARLGEWGVAEQSERMPEEKRFDRLTLLPLFIKALSLAMHEHPIFTCNLTPPSSTSTDHTLTRRSSHDISIALSSPSGGLYTPLLPSVNHSSPYTLASQIAHLQHCATTSSPPKFPAEFKGAGTITLSNVGVVGGTTTHPIVPPTGQLAIGALGRMRVEPRYVGKEKERAKEVARGLEELPFGEELKMEPRLLMDVTFSADHRVVEGVELAKLVESWKRLIEEPERIVGLGR